MAAARFIKKCSLPPEWKITIINVVTHQAPREEGIEVYHVSRGFSPEKDIASIVKNGFNEGSPWGNKGQGVYFADHGRYAINWARSSPVLVCQIPLDPSKVQRYRSEIYSPDMTISSEYVVTDRKCIIPLATITYTIECPDPSSQFGHSQFVGYVPHGFVGCNECDKLEIRCDCRIPFA